MDPYTIVAATTILGTELLSGWWYSRWLAKNGISRNPDHTWKTVVAGNSLILAGVAAFAYLGVIPWSAFWWTFGCNASAGAPVIQWQIAETIDRYKQAQARGRARLGAQQEDSRNGYHAHAEKRP